MNKLRHSSVLDLIGNTPMVPIRRLNPNPRVTVLAKLEATNPGGSVKDRIALQMIEAAEASGELTHGKVIIEATSGNTGIGLALIGAVKGYEVVLAMSEAVSLERRKVLAALGASFLLTKPELGTDGAIERVYRLVRTQPERYFMADQYNNPNNPLAHYQGTGREIIEQTGGAVTHFVAAIGTTGTLMGVSRRLKEFNPSIQIIAAEPYLKHKIQGLKNLKEAYRPGIFNKALLDEKINIADEHAFEMARRLALEEGIFAGMSSGAAMYVAIQKAQMLDSGVIVVLLPDGGERYLSTTLFATEDKRPSELALDLYNTLTRREERFLPIYPNEARMYTCGPTVHTHTHLGLCRRLLVADLLRRYLEYHGLSVKQVVNLTDMDDRTIQESERLGLTMEELTGRYIQEFLEDMETLRVRKATQHIRASSAIMEMIELTDRLMTRGLAYEKLRSVYFNISAAKDYGRLARLDLSKIRLGTTVDLDEYEKNNPADFTLFKRSTLAELRRGIFFETPWGNVRPGLHLECAAISTRHLGEQYDVHVSSTDLLFPHLENDLAMCKAVSGKEPVNHWVTSELVLHKGRKLSRSEGDPVNLRDLMERGLSGREIRFFLLSTHYRKPINLSPESLEHSRRILARMDRFIEALQQAPPGSKNSALARNLADQLVGGFRNAMDRDLNVSMAISTMFQVIKKANPYLVRGEIGQDEAGRILNALRSVDTVLAFLDLPQPKAKAAESEPAIPPEVLELARQRELARERKDFAVADGLRDRAKALGYEIRDTPQGSQILPAQGDRDSSALV
ncbi:MAG: cysteine--tRNA ligase [Bradymonadales bacterium]|nr:cysteine--tRNA ligase [Bradymonadales bacterium]